MADMEAMLMADSDSDDDTNAAAPPPPPPPVDANMSESDLLGRLKSLYNPANNAPRPPTAPLSRSPTSASASMPPPSAAAMASRLPAPLPPRQQMPSALIQSTTNAAATSTRPPDPFEPTPLTTMIQRQPSTTMVQPTMQSQVPSIVPQQHFPPQSSHSVQQHQTQRTMPPPQQQQQQQQQYPHSAPPSSQQQQYAPPKQQQHYSSQQQQQQKHHAPQQQQQQRSIPPQQQQQQRTMPPQQQQRAITPQMQQQHVQQQQQSRAMIPQQQHIQQQQRTMPSSQQQYVPTRPNSLPNPTSQLPPPLQANRPPSTNSTASTVRTSNITALSSSSNAAHARAKLEREAKQRKEKFLMFTRVLMKYLEQKDPAMHARAKSVIRECAEKNKAKEAGYESVTASMQARLRSTVGEPYWKRAETYLNHFLKQKEVELAKRKKAAAAVSDVLPSSALSQQHVQQQLQQLPQQLPPRPSPQQQPQPQIQQPAATVVISASSRELTRQQVDEAEKKNEASKNAALSQKKRDEQKRAIQKQHIAKQQQNLQKQQQAAQKLAQIQNEQTAQLQTIKQTNTAVASKQKAAGAPTSNKVDAAKKLPQPSISRKSSATTTPPTVTAKISPADVEQQPPREYAEFMDSLDHMVDYDWTTTGLLLSSKNDVDLEEEQRALVYGEGIVAPKPTFAPASRGWSQRNVVTARIAWARIRLPEQKHERRAIAAGNAPLVQGISLPSQPNTSIQAQQQKPETIWFNEDATESDLACAMLSEATEVYLKDLLEKGLTCARQRQNIQGVRLWHLQHGASKPPLSLRLGCEVHRQVAQSMGNAAKTVQRMEEAVDRSLKRPINDDPNAWSEASSMADMALNAPLASAVEQADYQAKRSFEIYGGKETGGPPFRVPKKAMIKTNDFKLGMQFSSFAHQQFGVAASNFL